MAIKILVIEDEDYIRGNIAEMLEDKGFEVLAAENGRVGVQLAQEELPDLILCDVMMPELNGYEVLAALHEDAITQIIPFIYLTAKTEKADLRRGMNLGADDYLTKPFTRSELLEAIDGRLAKQRKSLGLRKLEDEATYLLHYDGVTHLPNQFLLREQFNQLLNIKSDSQQTIPVLYVSLNQLSRLSLSLGNILYASLLSALAKRLRESVEIDDIVACLKEGQFVVILAQNVNKQTIARTAQNILDILLRPFNLEDRRVYLSVNIGISLYPEDDRRIDALILQAGIAAYYTRQFKNNSYQFYYTELDTSSREQFFQESSLRQALEEGQFHLHYQPQIDMKSKWKVVGAEALVRCFHPEHGMVSPVRFIPLAEETGLIIPIGEWILKTACQQARSWQLEGIYLRIAVNLSPRQFIQPELSQLVARTLQETGLDPHYLELEITEGCVMEDPQTAIATLNQLKDLGIEIAIDDFGTGYSSLGYIRQFPFDTLKIDRSFIQGIDKDNKNAEITKAIIHMAHSLNIRIIAEGVETREELIFLMQHDCDEIQGYLFSKPLPAFDFANFFQDTQKNGLSALVPDVLS